VGVEMDATFGGWCNGFDLLVPSCDLSAKLAHMYINIGIYV
jgi:hypothetical protein